MCAYVRTCVCRILETGARKEEEEVVEKNRCLDARLALMIPARQRKGEREKARKRGRGLRTLLAIKIEC